MTSRDKSLSTYSEVQSSDPSEQHGNLQAEVLRLRNENRVLKEREAALQEGFKTDGQLRDLMHRFKNSLSLQGSLLNLQVNALGDAPAVEELGKIRRRNDVIRMAYETAVFNGGRLVTEVGSFVSSVVSNVRDDLADGLEGIRATAAVAKSPNLDILLKNAIPLGLIVNELASNFYLHAVPRAGGDKHLEVSVRNVDGQLVLTLSNNGVDLPDRVRNLDPRGTLGLLLVKSLVKQVDASFTAESQEIVINTPMAVLTDGAL